MAVQPSSRLGDHGPQEPVGPILAAAIRAELADERARGESIHTRAMTLAAGAAAAAAIVFGLGSDYQGRWQVLFFILLLVAGLLFVASLWMAWWAVRIADHHQADLDEFQRLVDEGGDPDEPDLELYISTALIKTVKGAQEVNTQKSKWLRRALPAFLVGTVVVAAELGVVVADKVLR
jgi:MFS family permease